MGDPPVVDAALVPVVLDLPPLVDDPPAAPAAPLLPDVDEPPVDAADDPAALLA